MKKNIIASIVGLTVCAAAVAQQDPQFTQFFDNTLFVNPAYAGSKEVLNVTAMHREQWVGFDGRPTSTTLSIHSPLRYRSVGVGFTMVNDKNGPFNQTLFYADLSYTLKFKNNAKLAFGIKAGANLINVGTSTLAVTDANDANLLKNVSNRFNPNVGAGIYYHTPKFFVGVSTPRVLEQSYDGTKASKEFRHYFANVGGVFGVSETVKLRPMAQVKMTVGAPLSVDVSLAAIFNDKFYLGGLYRLNAAVGVFAQYQVSSQFKIGVATDFGTTAIRNYNQGTFEVLLAYDFIFKKSGIRSPRYF